MRWVRLLILIVLLVGSSVPVASAVAVGSAENGAASAFLTRFAQDGTPAAGEPLVIVAEEEASTATPSGEQTLRLAGPVQGPETLDPALAPDISTVFLVRQIYRGLTRLDADLEPVPELAERIEISADGLDYTFTLRPDILFHDGRRVTADDVVFSLTRALDPATAGGEASLLRGPTFLSDVEGASDLLEGRTEELQGAQAIDERTVAIRLAEPKSTFLMKLANPPAFVVDPEDVADGDEWWRSPNGTGPFMLEAWSPGEQMVLARFDGYFRGPAPLERVEVTLGPSALQSFNLYQSNAVDIGTLPLDSVDRVIDPGSSLRDEVTVMPSFAVHYVAFRTDVPPMDDPHIRRAVSLAFPAHKVAEVSYGGHVQVAEGIVPNGMLGRNWPVEGTSYDLDVAREAIAASSYGTAADVPPLRIYNAGGFASSIRDVLVADLGLEVEVIAVDWPEYVDGLALRSYPAYELYWLADFPDPESFLWTLFGSDSADNYVDYENEEFDALLRQAAAEQDPDRRAAFYAEAQQVLMDDHVVIPFYYDVAYTLSKPYVRGLEMTEQGIVRLETIWMER